VRLPCSKITWLWGKRQEFSIASFANSFLSVPADFLGYSNSSSNSEPAMLPGLLCGNRPPRCWPNVSSVCLAPHDRLRLHKAAGRVRQEMS